MTITQLTLNWNNTWRFDYWWRKKYNVPFNSEVHRGISQIDIKIEYIEHFLAMKQDEQKRKYDEDFKEFKETGKWIKENVDNKKENDLFDKMDLSSFNVRRKKNIVQCR
jgi:hypothetical protein